MSRVFTEAGEHVPVTVLRLANCQVIAHRTKDKNGYASGTPCTDGERIYAYFGNFGLLCLDLEGKQIWHKTVPTIDAYHGPSCSPLLYRRSRRADFKPGSRRPISSRRSAWL